MKIKQIWEELENDKSFRKGLLMRRYSSEVLPDIYIALQQPEKLVCVLASISSSLEIDLASFSNLQEIKVDVSPDLNRTDKNLLIFKLINNQHKDIFATLCEDLITSVANETNEKQLVRTLLNRFEKWKSLFDRISMQGLSAEEQRGLYGELFFLRKNLEYTDNYQNILNFWVGTTKDIRDFQFSNWALEVKTTIGNNHQKVLISSERQLDITHVENLFLYHISLQKVQGNGESLPQIINSIRLILNLDTFSLNLFKVKLYESGYFDHHENLYEPVGYHIRNDIFYKIGHKFPRIQEN